MLFSFDPQWMLGADGCDVLVYRTPDESPVWRFASRAPITAVALSTPHAIVLAQDGTVGWFDVATGQLRATTTVHPGALDLVTDAWGSALILYPDGLMLLDAKGARPLAAPQGEVLTAAAFAGQSRLIAVGTQSGRAHFFDGTSGMYGESVPVADKPVRALCGVKPGFWFATAGDAVYDVALVNVQRFTGAPGSELGMIAFDPLGQNLGIQLAPNAAIFIDSQSRDTLLNVSYPDRKVTGLGGVGPHGFAVGMDLGDANRFDRQRNTCRTEPHPGRPRNRWALMVGR